MKAPLKWFFTSETEIQLPSTCHSSHVSTAREIQTWNWNWILYVIVLWQRRHSPQIAGWPYSVFAWICITCPNMCVGVFTQSVCVTWKRVVHKSTSWNNFTPQSGWWSELRGQVALSLPFPPLVHVTRDCNNSQYFERWYNFTYNTRSWNNFKS